MEGKQMQSKHFVILVCNQVLKNQQICQCFCCFGWKYIVENETVTQGPRMD